MDNTLFFFKLYIKDESKYVYIKFVLTLSLYFSQYFFLNY